MISDALSGVEAKIADELRKRPECFITHPAELGPLQQLDHAELKKFADDHGWRVVRRLGGRQLQFYNDTNERLLNESGRTPVGGQPA
jgi:hypothetical protein